MGVVTISREMGSRGFEIASTLAEELSYRLVWREFINQAAIRAGVPEVALAMIDELNLLGICPSPQRCQAYIEAVELVLNELAQEDNIVIVGRGGQIVLQNRPGVLHVRIIAPIEIRIAWIASTKNITYEAALAQIQASDRAHKQYFQKFYQSKWDDPSLYDLTINTARLETRAAVEAISQIIYAQSLAKIQLTSIEGNQD